MSNTAKPDVQSLADAIAGVTQAVEAEATAIGQQAGGVKAAEPEVPPPPPAPSIGDPPAAP